MSVPIRGITRVMAVFNRFLVGCMISAMCAMHTFAAVPLSSVNITVGIAAADLAAVVNKSLPGELYKGYGEFGTSVTVTRTGPVAMTASDNFVFFTLPVQLKFRYAVYESYPLRTQLRFKARVNVASDWRLKAELYYTGLSDNLVDTFKLGPVSLKPKSIVESTIQPIQKILAPYIDDKINESVRLRAKMIPMWQNAFSPILVSKEFSTWLKLTPEKIFMAPMMTANNQIAVAMGIMTGAEMVVGPKPVAAPVKALPPVQQFTAFDRRFHIKLAADIFFADLLTALNPVLINKTFGEDKKITVKNFSLKGEKGRLLIVLNSSGDFDGELTLLAGPVYHPQTNTLTFENVDFDTKNTGWLISAGSWLLSSPIRRVIKTKLDAAVVEQLEAARLKASQALSSLKVDEHVNLTGAVRSLSLGETTVLNDRLSVHVVAQGELGVILK